MIRRISSAIISTSISVTSIFALILLVSDSGWRIYSNWVPTDRWMEVYSVSVENSNNGECPSMEVSRDIRGVFDAVWKVEAERKITTFYIFRPPVARGENNYSPDTELPEDLDLGWWTGYKLCTRDGKINLPQGTYRINTTWTISLNSYPPKRVSINSNDFKVE